MIFGNPGRLPKSPKNARIIGFQKQIYAKKNTFRAARIPHLAGE
jgi:hypothetical protein